MGVYNDNLIEETFLQYLKDNGYEWEDSVNESFTKLDLTLSKGTYLLDGNKIDIKEDRESFDSILNIPLFRIGDIVFSEYDLKRVQDEKL